MQQKYSIILPVHLLGMWKINNVRMGSGMAYMVSIKSWIKTVSQRLKPTMKHYYELCHALEQKISNLSFRAST